MEQTELGSKFFQISEIASEKLDIEKKIHVLAYKTCL
jgi:hypothetical protein